MGLVLCLACFITYKNIQLTRGYQNVEMYVQVLFITFCLSDKCD